MTIDWTIVILLVIGVPAIAGCLFMIRYEHNTRKRIERDGFYRAARGSADNRVGRETDRPEVATFKKKEMP